MRFSIRCPIFPTEDSDLIRKTLHSFFPDASFNLHDEDESRWFEATFSETVLLVKLRSLIHDSRIIDAARRLISASWTGTIFTIQLDKQAAVRNKINLIDESDNPPLGFIEVTSFCESDEAYGSFLNWLTPPTKDGKVLRT